MSDIIHLIVSLNLDMLCKVTVVADKIADLLVNPLKTVSNAGCKSYRNECRQCGKDHTDYNDGFYGRGE